MTALLLDEMLSDTIAAQLRHHGLDATAVVEEPALLGTPDEDLVVVAEAGERVLVTANIHDFVAIAAAWRQVGRVHHGLVYVPFRGFPQNRLFVGAVVTALLDLDRTGRIPAPGVETFLRRPASGSTVRCSGSSKRQ